MQRGGRRGSDQQLGPRAREQLRAAHDLAEAGDHAQAAQAFTRLATIAREHGMSRVATRLMAKAAESHARAGDRDGLVSATESAIVDARTDGDPGHASRAFGALLSGVRETPFAAAADDLRSAIAAAIGTAPREPQPPDGTAGVNRSQRRTLPAACLACGAPVVGARVRFDEDGEADCPFCGSILRA